MTSSSKALELAREQLPVGVGEWAAALAAWPAGEAEALVEELYAAWIAGELGSEPFAAEAAVGLLEADRRLGQMFAALPARLTESIWLEREAADEAAVRRWCWAAGWDLASQDEDLLLMDDGNVLPLLEEAGAGCVKREYVLSIVGHHARDSAHHALWDGANELAATLAKAGRWRDPARAAGAAELVAYLERLAGYAAVREVARDEAEQRVFDLRRCHPDAKIAPRVRRDGSTWVAPLARGNRVPGELCIEVAGGRMWAEEIR